MTQVHINSLPRIFAEYVDGGTLRDWIYNRKLYNGGPDWKLERVLDIGIQTAQGVGGYGVLAEDPGREIIFGGATQPWLANPVFRALPPTSSSPSTQPSYVKLAWTLRADPIDATKSVFRTETRVATTDPTSRAKFRGYWAFVSPSIILISMDFARAAESRSRAPVRVRHS